MNIMNVDLVLIVSIIVICIGALFFFINCIPFKNIYSKIFKKKENNNIKINHPLDFLKIGDYYILEIWYDSFIEFDDIIFNKNNDPFQLNQYCNLHLDNVWIIQDIKPSIDNTTHYIKLINYVNNYTKSKEILKFIEDYKQLSKDMASFKKIDN